MKGMNSSRTVGHNGPAIIYSTSRTSLDGEKRFYIDAEGIHAIPAQVNAHVRTRVTGVATNKGPILDRIIKKIAWKRIPKEKGKSEREAAVHAKRMLAKRLDAESGVLLAQPTAVPRSLSSSARAARSVPAGVRL